jgi:hypothetical protein
MRWYNDWCRHETPASGQAHSYEVCGVIISDNLYAASAVPNDTTVSPAALQSWTLFLLFVSCVSGVVVTLLPATERVEPGGFIRVLLWGRAWFVGWCVSMASFVIPRAVLRSMDLLRPLAWWGCCIHAVCLPILGQAEDWAVTVLETKT